MKIIILAGGTGTRLWPFSREHSPKQVLPMLGRETLLQQTFKRLRLAWPAKDILVVTGKKYAIEIKKQLPELPKANLLMEPVRRDSAGAIGLAAAIISRVNRTEVIVSVHADHWIADPRAYVNTLKRAAGLLKHYPNKTVVVGIKPSYPETGYGYIQLGKKIVQADPDVYGVKSFKEKPALETAQKFLLSQRYLWNVGWFAWRVDYLLALYKKYLPQNFQILNRITNAPQIKLRSTIDKEFPKLKPAPIEKSIIEKTQGRLTLKIEMIWADIGHWRSVYEMSTKDKEGNVVLGQSLLLDSRDNFFWVSGKKPIASLGVSNLILIETPDIIFVADKDQAQNVKNLVTQIKKNRRFKKYL